VALFDRWHIHFLLIFSSNNITILIDWLIDWTLAEILTTCQTHMDAHHLEQSYSTVATNEIITNCLYWSSLWPSDSFISFETTSAFSRQLTSSARRDLHQHNDRVQYNTCAYPQQCRFGSFSTAIGCASIKQMPVCSQSYWLSCYSTIRQ